MFVLPYDLSFYFLPFLFFMFFFFKFFSNTSHKYLPPSPQKVPIFGNLHQVGLFPHRSLRSLAKKYGPVMLLHFGNKPVLVVSSAFAAREIMKTHDLAFSSRPESSVARRIFYDTKDVALCPYGEHWKQVKRICVLHLLSNKRVRSFRNVREEETALMVDKIISHSSSALVNLSDMLVSLMNNVMCRVALGNKYGREGGGRRLKELLGRVEELLGVYNMADYIPCLAWINGINGWDAKLEKVAKEMDAFLEEVVEEHTDRSKRERGDGSSGKEGGRQDFVDILLEINSKREHRWLLSHS